MQRISPITGRPVRTYTRRNQIVQNEPQVVREVKKNILKVEDFKVYNEPYYNMTSQTLKSDNDKYMSTTIYLSAGPTINCQLAIAGNFGHFLTIANNIVDQLKVIQQRTRKNILLVDIKQCYMKYFNEKIPEKNIITVSPYKSTNGSNMNICLINLKNL